MNIKKCLIILLLIACFSLINQPVFAASTFTDATSTYGIGDGTVTHYSSAWADFDKDGDLDLYTVNNGSNNHLFLNNGPDQAMTDVTSTYGVADGTKAHRNAAWIDIDNDGDLDLYAQSENANSALFRNDGVGVAFTDVASTYGIQATTPNNRTSKWVDIDSDGDLDYFQDGQDSGHSNLFINNGPNQTMTDASTTYGLDIPVNQSGTWVDFDNDGDMDFMSSMETGSTYYLMQNNGANTAFTNVSSTYFSSISFQRMSSNAWGDVDNDGDLDVYFSSQGLNNKLMINNGTGQAMTDAISTYGVGNSTGTHYSAIWIDIDNDGDLDLYAVTRSANNKIYQNNGVGQTMTDVTSSYGIADGTTSHRSASFIDVDNDGDLDLYSVSNGANNKLYINPGQGNKYLHIKVNNTSGIYQYDARIEVDIDGNADFSTSGSYLMQYQTNASYGGNVQYLTSMSPVGNFFGLGSSADCKYDIRVFLPGIAPSATASYTKENVCPNQVISFPITETTSTSQSLTGSTASTVGFAPQIPQGNDGNTGGGVITPVGDSQQGIQKILSIIEPYTLTFNAFLSSVEQRSLQNVIDTTKSLTNIVIAGGENGIVGIKKSGKIYWQIGKIHSIWYKAYPPLNTTLDPAKIIPELQKKPSILGISYSQENLIPPGNPKALFNQEKLAIAHSVDGSSWTILPTSVVDINTHTVAALDEIGGYYMIVGY